ncbi:hypothetical protein BLS_005970 [Venturia inaequalis]|uniref:LisH domain-containing protein n=1 Tax=Venturia inaequalis TaxID=5025 RepID=A0A8H3UFC3_VENIN|nr:hypothetical protein BLS_005970 [Venturia inaequalis]
MNAPGGSMVTMNNNPAQGGPVGSATMINQVSARQRADQLAEQRLNTYIYDYLCRSHHYELARAFSENLPILKAVGKPRTNGADDSMDTDIKEDPKRPDGLPYPDIANHASEHAFLYDWWVQFWDIFGAARNKQGGQQHTAEQYLQQHMNQTKLRQMQQNQLLNQTGGNNMLRMQQMGIGMPPNGLNNLQKAAFQNRPGAPNAAMMQQKMMAQGNLQRDGSMGENRPQSPNAMGGNAPSPSKRPRTDDGPFNPGPAGRGQAMQGQLSNMNGGPNGTMLLQNGMPSEMPQQQMNAFAQNGHPKLEAMGPNGAVPGPMGAQSNMEFPGMGGRDQMQANGQNGTSQGNHALQDYQMQLMLLEQQNKKRLLMARQEQDNVNHVPVNTPGGQSTTFTQNMSPSGSRAGPSPNPNDQIRKIAGTPKMGQNLPGSPAMQGDMQNRATPPGNGYHEMPGVLQHQQRMFSNQGNPMMPGQGGPSSNPGFNNMQMPSSPMNPQQMEQLRLNGGRMPNGQPWQANAQQMMQQGPQGQGTPQQRHSTMPPPPAPNNQEQQRTQPSSPAQTAAPPTPNQTNKANPKGKKEGATKKKAATKKGAAASTPAESNDPPATPTPSTPITPMHQQAFNPNGKPNGQPPQVTAQPPQSTNHMDAAFTDLVGQDPNNAFALDFAVEGPDVLENFDFDSFLHNTDDTQGFGTMDFMSNFGNDGIEAGAE